MSTRGWYEYYVLDLERNEMSLAMQFYKWGDATPENAIYEYSHFIDMLTEHKKNLPLDSVDNFLKNQLGYLYDELPKYFHVGVLFFMLQRASEELSYYKRLNYMHMDEKKRPDYLLYFELGKQKYLKDYYLPSHDDKYLLQVEYFLAIGSLIREWKKYGLRLNVLEWLQYITQITLEYDMGSIAGSFSKREADFPSYLYRFFICINYQEKVNIDSVRLNICNIDGSSVLAPCDTNHNKDMEEQSYKEQKRMELINLTQKYNVNLYSYEEALGKFKFISDNFWKIKENPPLD